MITKISNKIHLLSSSSKLLVVGTLSKELEETLDIYFTNKVYLNLNSSSLDNLNESYYKEFDIILFAFTKSDFNLYSKQFNSLPNKAICIIDDEIFIDFKSFLNSSFSTLVNPFDEEIFLEKVFALLAIEEVESILKRKEKVVNRFVDDDTNNKVDEFLDKYSGKIMFINDDLNESLERLKDLEVSEENFKKISLSLVNLSNVMKMNKNLLSLSALFLEFSQFLNSLVLQDIEPSRYSAFDYLTKIIEDLTIYIDELFVYKLFKDVGIFEDSMSNNILYLEAQLFGLEEDDSNDNLEFF